MGSAFPSNYHLPSPSLPALCPLLCVNVSPFAPARLSLYWSVQVLALSNNLLGTVCWKVITGTTQFITEKRKKRREKNHSGVKGLRNFKQKEC